MSERIRLPYLNRKPRSKEETKKLAGAALGALALNHVMTGENDRIKPRRAAILTAVGATAGYFISNFIPGPEAK